MSGPDLLDEHPSHDDIFDDVLAGLREPQKWIAPMYFYDERGSQLFDRICELPEYYPTRTELAILDANAAEIAAALGPRVALIEPGSGSGDKARRILRALEDPVAFIPVEISREHLMRSARSLDREFPSLEVTAVWADFSQPFALPELAREPARRVVFFPGSTIGNFAPARAARLLANFRSLVGADGLVLVGVDLRKDPAVLERAYNDAAGVTAEFNLNVLRRLNDELGAGFDLDAFEHRAIWNDAASRIEMHLVSRRAQTATLGDEVFSFAAGEYIHTESSYKYSLESFASLAARAGLTVRQVWTDERDWFSLQLLQDSGGT